MKKYLENFYSSRFYSNNGDFKTTAQRQIDSVLVILTRVGYSESAHRCERASGARKIRPLQMDNDKSA